MTDLTNEERAENEHSLDPREKWGQGTDASHPVSAIAHASPDTPGAADDGEMTETANRLRRSVGMDRSEPAARERDDNLPADDDDTIPDDMPLA